MYNMAYCFMHIQKVKSYGTLTSKYNQNYRIADVKNADKENESLNEEIICLPNGKTYIDVCRERIKEIEKNTGRKVRKDAVLAYEIVTTFSRSAFINVDEWKKANEKWMKETFDKAPDGKSNVISMVYHADEAGNVHCHTLVLPINEKGYLSARSFINGSKEMTKLQDSYAKAMEEVGLERGQKGSIATHKNIRRLYADLNNLLENIPEPEENESALSYKERILEDIKNMRASNLRECDERIQKADRRITESYMKQKQIIQKEADDMVALAHAEVERIKRENIILEKKMNELQNGNKELRLEKMELEQSVLDLREMQNQLNEYCKRRNTELKRMKLLQDRLDKLFATDPEEHRKIMDILNHTASKNRDDTFFDNR